MLRPNKLPVENITVASDVYSLGVILYELLTGKRPYELKDKPFVQILKIIETAEPVPPSKIVDSKSKILNSELDAIVLKSLAKSPDDGIKRSMNFA